MQGNLGSWVVLLLFAAFAIERIIAAASFLLGPPPSDNVRALQRRGVLLFGLAAAVALAIVNGNSEVRLLGHLQPGRRAATYDYDYWLTWLVLVAGSDQVRSVVQWIGGTVSAAKEVKEKVAPVRIEVDDGVNVRKVA